jgi:hypothetical protein
MNQDFAHLYRQLGLRPNCSLDEFKQAYRRTVARLHPDRVGAEGMSAAMAQLPLPDLMALYARALRFHRAHGRLPGATSPGRSQRNDDGGTANVPPSLPSMPVAEQPKSPWLFVVLVVAALVTLVVLWQSPADPDARTGRIAPSASPAIDDAVPPAQLRPGMDADAVLAIQGEPLQRHGNDWEYGPSWVKFDQRGRLVDWYSSPLHRLKAATDAPRLADVDDRAAEITAP